MRSNTAAAADAVAAAVSDLQEHVTGGRARDLGHDVLADLLGTVRREQARLEAVALAVVAEVDARGSHVHDGALSTGAWLRMLTRVVPGEAARTVRAARALATGALPLTCQALAAGAVSVRHVEVIADGVQDAPAGAVALIEPEALARAAAADPRSTASLMRQFRHALDPEDADQGALRRLERRGLTLAATLDGSFALRGTADEVSGAVIATAVDAASPPVTGDPRTPAQRRLDGLTEICRRFLADPAAPSVRGGHPHVLVTVDETSLRARSSAPVGSLDLQVDGTGRCVGAGPGAVLGWVGMIGATTAARIACDAQVTRTRIGVDGEVRDSTTERRFFTAAQRRAIVARDGDRCCWPFCDRPVAWADGHHLRHWSTGGPTTVANGALPCTGHHTMLHEGGWRAQRTTDGRYVVRSRSGRVIGPEPDPPGSRRPVPHRRT